MRCKDSRLGFGILILFGISLVIPKFRITRHSLSPESEKDLLTQEELSFLKLPGFLKLKDPRILSLKMFPVCYRMTKAGRFAPSSVRFLNWGTMSNGKCLTARISESPKQGNGQAGITEATQMVTSYFEPGTKLIYAIGAVVGLIGG